MPTHDSMNIDIMWTQPYAPVESDEWKNQIVKELCFNCSQKEHLYKNCLMNFYSKIWQMIMNLKPHAVSVSQIEFETDDKSENKMFWDQVAPQNWREKKNPCIYALLTQRRKTIYPLIWMAKYDLLKNEPE